jgi:hypothetical protein
MAPDRPVFLNVFNHNLLYLKCATTPTGTWVPSWGARRLLFQLFADAVGRQHPDPCIPDPSGLAPFIIDPAAITAYVLRHTPRVRAFRSGLTPRACSRILQEMSEYDLLTRLPGNHRRAHHYRAELWFMRDVVSANGPVRIRPSTSPAETKKYLHFFDTPPYHNSPYLRDAVRAPIDNALDWWLHVIAAGRIDPQTGITREPLSLHALQRWTGSSRKRLRQGLATQVPTSRYAPLSSIKKTARGVI